METGQLKPVTGPLDHPESGPVYPEIVHIDTGTEPHICIETDLQTQ